MIDLRKLASNCKLDGPGVLNLVALAFVSGVLVMVSIDDFKLYARVTQLTTALGACKP